MSSRLFRRFRHVSERGEGQTQLIVTLSIIALIAFVGIKAGPVYWQEKNIKYDMEELTRKAGIGSMGFQRDDQIQKEAKKILNSNQAPDDTKFECTKSGGTITTKVSYMVPIEFYVYTWNYEVNLEIKDAIGKY
jgi:hypothetical protein